MVKSYNPQTLKEALEICNNYSVTPYAGGTDLMVHPNENSTYLFLNNISEIKNIVEDDSYIRIGAGCTFTEILKSPLSPAILKDAIHLLAAPAIRNFGTVGGNICNGSAKADSAIVFFALDAKLRIASATDERMVPIADFYLGKNKTVIMENELLIEILINKSGYPNYYYKKVGARDALAISRIAFAATISIDSSNTIQNLCTAFGAISNVIISEKQIDGILIGKTLAEAKKLKPVYIDAYDKAILPIKGRVSVEYRKSVCMNLLRDFLESKGI
jgi:CO/xanthine dehydrogenase FAD-binding subunit